MEKQRIIFAGTPDFAATHLQALIEKSQQADSNFEIIAVYTQMDRPAGRGHKLTFSPVKTIALEHNIPVYQPLNFKQQEDIDTFVSLKADLCIVVAYGLILPQAILDAPRLGCINVHGSLLPKWRGAAPIQRSLLSGEDVTGVTIMQIVAALDAGDMLLKQELKIEPTDTSASLFAKMAQCGAQTLANSLEDILQGKFTPEKQDESQVTYASKLSKEESLLNFAQNSAKHLELQVRGLNPWPIATFSLDQTVYKVFEAKVFTQEEIVNFKLDPNVDPSCIVGVCKDGLVIKCAQDFLALKTIQAPGKGRVNASDFARSKADIFVRGKCCA